MSALLPYLRAPFGTAALLVLGCFWIGIMFAARAGLAGLPLALILFSWFSKYCFVVLDATLAGAREPPPLAIEHVNPIDEQRPLGLLAWIGLTVLAVRAIGTHLGWPVELAAGVLGCAALPAGIAVLGLTRNPLRAAWPPDLWRCAHGLGRDYFALLTTMLVAIAGVTALARSSAALPITALVAQLALLSLFALIGGALHENRAMLDLAISTPAERAAARDAREHLAARARMLDRAYAQANTRQSAAAWSELTGWLAAHEADDEYDALLDATGRWSDTSLADRLTDAYLARLLGAGQTGRAVAVLERRVSERPAYRPADPTQLVRLAELAALAGKPALQRTLTGREPEGRGLADDRP